MKKITFILLCLCVSGVFAQDSRERVYQYEISVPKHEWKEPVKGYAESRITEKIDRGLTAVLAEDGKSVYLSWRLLNSDVSGTGFNIYRNSGGISTRINDKPLYQTTDFIDNDPAVSQTYFVKPILSKKEGQSSEIIEVQLNNLRGFDSVKLKPGERAGKLGVADLNGDGKFDFIIRTPNSNVDPGMPGDTTGITFKITAYLHDGTYLWTHDMGLGIEPGIWYSPFVVFDFNGDGKAEVAIKGTGNDYVKNEKGRVVGGSEFLLILDGLSGKVIDQVNWPERNFRYGDVNRQNRNQMGMAYLDGKTPCILAARGTYRLMVVDAWQLKGNKLEKLWRWDGDEENPVVRSQGAHSMVAGDVDNDGKDEILLGSCMLDDNGTLLWSAGLGHTDKIYLTNIDPRRKGMQVFMVSEPWQDNGRGVSMVDAATGKFIWGIGKKTFHVGDGMVADIDASKPGLECFASEDQKGGSTDRYLFTSDGQKMETDMNDIPGCRNWVWWDSDLIRETIIPFRNEADRKPGQFRSRKMQIIKWKGEKFPVEIDGDIQMIADLQGDWREEIITILPGEIRIYKTNIPARDKRITLMQDPVYRSYILHRSMGYPQSPVPGFYLGE